MGFYNELVERIGDFGIFHSFLGTYNIVNMETKRICAVMNFLTIEEARKYIDKGEIEY